MLPARNASAPTPAKLIASSTETKFTRAPAGADSVVTTCGDIAYLFLRIGDGYGGY
jgi:hypothetical protein